MLQLSASDAVDLRARIPALVPPSALTAGGIIIDSLGRRWNPAKHPRDRKGRFIETFGEIRAFMRGKGYTKPDFTGRVIALNEDGTGVVQVTGGRGEYAKMIGRLARVPLANLENAEYKARIGQRPSPANDVQRQEINGFIERMRADGRTPPGFTPGDDIATQLKDIEALAEFAEDNGDNDARDALLDIKSALRGEPSSEEVEREVKALLGVNPDETQPLPTPTPEPAGTAPALPETKVETPAETRVDVPEGWEEVEVPPNVAKREGYDRAFQPPDPDDPEVREYNPGDWRTGLFEDPAPSPEAALERWRAAQEQDRADAEAKKAADAERREADRIANNEAARERAARRTPYDEALKIAQDAGAGEGVLEAIKTGDRDQIRDALRADPTLGERFHDWETSADVDLPTKAQKEKWARDGEIFDPVLRSEAAPPETKAELPTPQEAPDAGSPTGQPDAEAPGPVQPTSVPGTPVPGPEGRGDGAGVPGEGAPGDQRAPEDGGGRAPGTPEAGGEEVREPKPARPRERVAQLTPPRTQAQAWAMLLGLQWGGMVTPRNNSLFNAGSRRKHRKRMALREEIRSVIEEMNLSPEGTNAISVRALNSRGDAFEVESGVLPDENWGGGKELVPVGSPVGQLAVHALQVLGDLPDGANDTLVDAVQKMHFDLMTGDIDAAREGFEANIANHPEFANRPATVKAFRDAFRGFAEPGSEPTLARIGTPPKPTEFDGWDEVDPLQWANEVWDRDTGLLYGHLIPDDYAGKKKLREMMAHFVRIHNGDVPQRVIRNRTTEQEIAIHAPTSPELLAAMVKAHEEMHAYDPLLGQKVSVLLDFGNSNFTQALEYRGVHGESMIGSRAMRFDVNKLQKALDEPRTKDGLWMPSAYGDDPYLRVKYVVAHEWGHMRSDSGYMGHNQRERMDKAWNAAGVPAPNRRTLQGVYAAKGRIPYRWSDWYGADKRGEALKGYEAYAEHFAEWVISGGKTSDKRTIAFAREFELNKNQLDAPDPGQVPKDIADSPGLGSEDVLWNELNDALYQYDPREIITSWKNWITLRFADDPVLQDNVRRALDAVLGDLKPENIQFRAGMYEAVLNGIPDHTVRDTMNSVFRKGDPAYAEAEARQIQRWDAVLGMENPTVHTQRATRVARTMFPSRSEQETAAAVLMADGMSKDTAMYLFPDAELSPEYLEYVGKLLDMEQLLLELDPADRGPENIPAAHGNLPDADAVSQNYYRSALWRKNSEGFDVTAGVEMFNAIYPAARIEDIGGKPSPVKDIPAPEPVAPSPPPPPVPPAPPGEAADKFPTKIKNLAEEFFRGRSKGAKRGVGNIHLAERIAYGKDGVELRKNDVVWFPQAGGQQKRPAGDGYIVNMGIAQEKIPQFDADGNPILDAKGKQVVIKRPKLDAAGNPIVTKIVVRHFDPAYIGGVHAWAKERAAGQAWPFPYWDYTIDGKKLELVPDENPRAQHVIEEFGLHGRRMAGRGAGRIAPIIGKVFRLERMRNAVPIQNRFLRDKDNKLIGEGDIVRYDDELYEIVRPNNPWDMNGVPRVQMRPVGGGELRQVGAHRVEYVDDAQNLVFFRGVGGIAAPQLQDVKDLISRLGVSDADLNDAIAKKDFVAVAKRLSMMPEVAAFLDAEGTRRKQIRDRIEIDNGGRAVPAGHVPVSEFEYLQAQREKADAVILHAAKNGLFADEDGNPPDIPEQVQKDLFGDYVGDEADIAMRSKYIDLYEKVDADAAVVPEGDTAAKEAYALVQNQKKVNLAVVGAAHLPDPVQRAKAQVALNWLARKYKADGDADGEAKVAELKAAIERWGVEFDARNRGGAPAAPAAPAAPVAPRTPPAPPTPAAPAAGGTEDLGRALDGVMARRAEVGVLVDSDVRRLRRILVTKDAVDGDYRDVLIDDLLDGLDAERKYFAGLADGPAARDRIAIMDALKKAKADFDAKKAAPAAPAAKPRLDLDLDAIDMADYKKVVDAVKKIRAHHKVTGDRDVIRAWDVLLQAQRDGNVADIPVVADALRDEINVKRGEGFENFADDMDNLIDKYMEVNAPAAPAVPTPVPAGPAISDEDIRFAVVRGRVNGKNHKALYDVAEGREPNREQLDGAIADLDVMLSRYARGARPEKAEQAQRVRDALVAVRDQMDARDAEPVEPVGRTEAVEDIFDRIGKAVEDLKAKGKRAAARKLEGRADDIAEYFDKAQEAHEADDKEARDRWLKDIDLALDGMTADGHKDLADELRRQVAGNRARFEADDNRAEPMDRQEGADLVDAAVADIGLDELRRKGGPEGRARAREVREKIDAYEDAIDAADAERDKDARDALFDQAQEAADVIRPEYPDLADVMDAVLAGQRARKDAKQGGEGGMANPSDVARDPNLDRRGGDPDWVDDVDGDSPEAIRFRQFAEEIRGLGLDDIVKKIQAGEIPGAVKIKRLNPRGLIGVQKVTMDDGSIFVIKSDVEYEAGAPAEDVMARLARAAGMRAPMVAMLNPYDKFSRDSRSPRGVLLMQYTGDLVRDDEVGIWDADLVAGGREGAPSVDIKDYKNYTEDGIRDLLGLALMDTAGRNPDRHVQNYQLAVTKDGKLRPVVIDNGRSLHWMTDRGYGTPSGSNMLTIQSSGPQKPVQRWLASLTEDQARTEMEAFLTRMRDRAEKIRTIEQRDNDLLVEQFQWALDNLDKMVSAWRRR